MTDDHEVDWGNDEDDPILSRAYFDSVGMGRDTGGVETDDVEDAVSLGGDEEEEFAAYGARSNEQNTPSADKFQTTFSKRDARRRSASIGMSPRKGMNQVQPPLPRSPQPETRQPTPKLTHALPRKPVVSSSIRPPPSTTAASPMSLPRKERRSNGNGTKKSDDASLSDKETKSSRPAGRESRRRESNADEPSRTRPGSNTTDSHPLPRDRAKSVNDREVLPPMRRGDDCYRPDEEGWELNSYRPQPRHDARYRYDDRDRHHEYTGEDRADRPAARSARLTPEDESLDRSRTGYRESNDSDSRRAHPRDRDASPVRDDNSRRVVRRDDYPAYDSFDKSSRDYGDSSRRNSGTAERSRYPESFNGRTNSVDLRDSHTQNQGPGRSSTLRRNSPSPRPRSRSPPYIRRDDRRPSPPRYQEYVSDTSRHPLYRGRAESPPPRIRVPNRQDRRDTPPDLPQRRPRGISDVHDPDYAPKRRKMDDDDGNLPPVRRGPAAVDTYIPLETSTASTSPRSTGALDDLSRQRRREPLPPQSHRYKEASDLAPRPPLSGSNRIMPQPQPSAQPPHRHYPPRSRDNEVFPTRHPDADLSRLDRSRGSGRDPGYVYADKFNRDDHMKVDPPYPPRGVYEEPVRDLANRTSSHSDTISRGPIPPAPHPRPRENTNMVPATPIVPASTIEKAHRRSRDRSPRHHHEPRQMSKQSSSASLPTMQSGPPQDKQFVDDYRHRGRRNDRDREDHSPTLVRHPSNPVAVRSRSRGRRDVPDGGPHPLRSPELRAAPPIQEQPRHHTSGGSNPRRERSNPRRERQVPLVVETKEIPPPRVDGQSIPMHSPSQERASRSGPPPDIDFPAPPAPAPVAREWIPRQPEFLLNLPPPSTRLPGAPPPPNLPPSSTRLPGAPPPPILPVHHPYAAPLDPTLYPRLPPSQNENSSAKVEDEPGQEHPQEKYKHEPSSPVRQTKVILPSPTFQTQERHHEQMPHKYSDRTSRAPASDGRKENPAEERYIPVSPEESRETIPASWDRPREKAPPPARKLLTLPASLPPKPVAALGDLNMQSSSRAGQPPRGRRSQQQSPDEGNGQGAKWPRGDGGRDKDRERRWGPTPEYRGPSLLARMSSTDLPGGDMMERPREGGEIPRKRVRSRKYHG